MITASLVGPISAGDSGQPVRRCLVLAVRRSKTRRLAAPRQRRLQFSQGRDRGQKTEIGPAMMFDEVLRGLKISAVSGQGSGEGSFLVSRKARRFFSHSFGAHFAEVTWQPDIARLRVVPRRFGI